ncbi:MAG: hypothetical protein NT013_30295 [Planctomycetia bacterium]|nr:hypothetical protein [Planctomycetia bacterium]
MNDYATDLMVTGVLNAANNITFRASNIAVAPNAVIQTRAIGGSVDLRTTGTFMIGATTTGTNPALIQSDALLHLMADTLSLDGQINSTSSTGRIVINAVRGATFFGEVNAVHSLAVHAGVGASWTDQKLFGAVTVADLSGGDVTINGGTLTSPSGSSEIIAGGNINVIGATTVGSDPVPVQRPIIITVPRTIEVITGTRQVAVGSIFVPVVSFVTTKTTEQVGTESVRVGSAFHTANVTLTQLGYYNPNAPADKRFRKTFVEGIDYTNATLDWSKYYNTDGEVKTLPIFTAGTGKEFGQLSDLQRDAVLVKLGYRKYYDVSFKDLKTNNTINGIPTQIDWHPSWENAYQTKTVDTTFENGPQPEPQPYTPADIKYQDYADTVSVRLSVDGWRDKYVRLPAGAETDIERVVSQGEANAFQEDVGDYYDQARVTYIQDQSANTAVQTSPYSRQTDIDGVGIRWNVSYYDSGNRWYSINDGRTDAKKVSEPQNPLWNQGGKSQAADINNNSIYVQTGYTSTTRVINSQSNFNTYTNPRVGDIEHLVFSVRFDVGLTYSNIRTGGQTDLVTTGNWSLLVSFGSQTSNKTDVFIGPTPVGGSFFDPNFLTVDEVYHDDNPRFVIAPFFFAQSNDGSKNTYFNGQQQSYLIWDGFVGFQNLGVSFGVNPILYNGRWVDKGDVPETYHDYLYNWESRLLDLSETRQQLSYQLVTSPTDVYDLRPKFETGESTVKVVAQKSVTQWQTQNITEAQTVLTTQREFEEGSALQGGFGAPSLTALNTVTIAAGQDVSVQGIVQSTGADQLLTITAGRDVFVDGFVPEGAPTGTLPAIAGLQADGQIIVNAGRDATLGAASVAVVDADNVLEAKSEVSITAGRNAVVAGTVTTLDKVTVTAPGDISLTGSVTATHLIQATAGTDGTGSIIGSINTQLTTFGSQIILTSGATSGDITLTDSTLSSSPITGFISLTALGGHIAQSGGTATGKQFKSRAKNGITANTVVSEYDVQNSGTGDVTLLNSGNITFVSPLTTLNGAIGVTVFGDATVGSVTNNKNVTFTVTGQLTQTANQTISGGLLTLATGSTGLTLQTAVSQIALTTHGTGDVSINNIGTQPFELNVVVTDGSLNVTTAGSLLVTNVVSLTNSDANDVTLNATGNIDIALLNAGVFAATDADARLIRLAYLSGALRASGFLSNSAPDLTSSTYASLDTTAARASLVNWLTPFSAPCRTLQATGHRRRVVWRQSGGRGSKRRRVSAGVGSSSWRRISD